MKRRCFIKFGSCAVAGVSVLPAVSVAAGDDYELNYLTEQAVYALAESLDDLNNGIGRVSMDHVTRLLCSCSHSSTQLAREIKEGFESEICAMSAYGARIVALTEIKDSVLRPLSNLITYVRRRYPGISTKEGIERLLDFPLRTLRDTDISFDRLIDRLYEYSEYDYIEKNLAAMSLLTGDDNPEYDWFRPPLHKYQGMAKILSEILYGFNFKIKAEVAQSRAVLRAADISHPFMDDVLDVIASADLYQMKYKSSRKLFLIADLYVKQAAYRASERNPPYRFDFRRFFKCQAEFTAAIRKLEAEDYPGCNSLFYYRGDKQIDLL